MEPMQDSIHNDTLVLRNCANAVKAACLEAALSGYERASISGLCAQGAFEAAISAVRMVELESIIANPPE